MSEQIGSTAKANDHPRAISVGVEDVRQRRDPEAAGHPLEKEDQPEHRQKVFRSIAGASMRALMHDAKAWQDIRPTRDPLAERSFWRLSKTVSAVRSASTPPGARTDAVFAAPIGHGPKRSGAVGPKMASTRFPTAAERCMRPLSLPMKTEGWRTREVISSSGQPVRLRKRPSGISPDGEVGAPAHHAIRLPGMFSQMRCVSRSKPRHSFSAPRLSVKITNRPWRAFEEILPSELRLVPDPEGEAHRAVEAEHFRKFLQHRDGVVRAVTGWEGDLFPVEKPAPSRLSRLPQRWRAFGAKAISELRSSPCMSHTMSNSRPRSFPRTSRMPRSPSFLRKWITSWTNGAASTSGANRSLATHVILQSGIAAATPCITCSAWMMSPSDEGFTTSRLLIPVRLPFHADASLPTARAPAIVKPHAGTTMSQDPQEIADTQTRLTGEWHHEEPAATGSGFNLLVAENHLRNFLLWHEEDVARRDDLGSGRVHEAKRAIDGYNQQRNNFIEEMDKASSPS